MCSLKRSGRSIGSLPSCLRHVCWQFCQPWAKQPDRGCRVRSGIEAADLSCTVHLFGGSRCYHPLSALPPVGTTSCGIKVSPSYMLVGTDQKLGRLTVLHLAKRHRHRIYSRCECACGVVKEIRPDALPGTRSYGCLQREAVRRRVTCTLSRFITGLRDEFRPAK